MMSFVYGTVLCGVVGAACHCAPISLLCTLHVQGGAGAGGASGDSGAAAGMPNPAMLASLLGGLGGGGAGAAGAGGAAGGAAGGLDNLMQMLSSMGGMGGMGGAGFGAPAAVADPATHYASQIQQLQVGPTCVLHGAGKSVVLCCVSVAVSLRSGFHSATTCMTPKLHICRAVQCRKQAVLWSWSLTTSHMQQLVSYVVLLLFVAYCSAGHGLL